jgi:PAS domain S-box-containing protein
MNQTVNPPVFGEGGETEAQYPGLATVLLDGIPSSVLILDRGLRVTLANRNFLEKARRRAETTVGRRLEEVFPPAIVAYTQLDQRTRGVFQDGRSFEGGKMTYRAPGVPQRVYYYSLMPLRNGNVVTGVLLMMHDITEQERLTQDVRRAERHLASVVESANDLVVSMNPDGLIMTWNQAAERVSGFPVSAVLGHDLGELCWAEDREQMRALLSAVSQGEPGKVHELNLRTRQGKVIPVAWACSPMWDEQGRVGALVAVGRDLTERHLLEAQLFQSAKMASLGVMAGGIAHQLRNPLGAASAAAQLMLRDPDNKELGRQCAQKIYEGIKRASAIIESLLRFARPDSGAFGAVQVNDVLEDTVAMLHHQANLSQVQVETALTPGLPPVSANSSALQQAFTNLFLNACQAMPAGGRLSVCSRLAETGAQIQIDFCDTGCGIPAENLNQVFDPFFTTRPVGQGVGLGLAIAYSIAQQHGGNIQVRSTVGVGSTFTVTLPIHGTGYLAGGGA